MDPKPVQAIENTRETPAPELETQDNNSEIETEWHTALQGELSALVPSKLPISQLPVRYAA